MRVMQVLSLFCAGSPQCKYAILRHIWPQVLSFTAIKMANESASQEMGKSVPRFGVLAIHAGQELEQWNSRAVVPPISMATTFMHLSSASPRGGTPG